MRRLPEAGIGLFIGEFDFTIIDRGSRRSITFEVVAVLSDTTGPMGSMGSMGSMGGGYSPIFTFESGYSGAKIFEMLSCTSCDWAAIRRRTGIFSAASTDVLMALYLSAFSRQIPSASPDSISCLFSSEK